MKVLGAVLIFIASLPVWGQVAIRELSRETILGRLERSAVENSERQAILKNSFEEAGCKGERLREQPLKYSRLGNIVCTLPGEGEGIIVVGAHFDAVDDGDGMADNWSGASLLPCLYETLSSRPRRHTFVFVGFTDEEKGMYGSEFYAKQMTRAERARTRAMVNLDTLGLGPTAVWLSHSDAKLAGYALKVARAMKLPLTAVNFEKVGATDSISFEKVDIPSITLHSVTQENHHILHSPLDRLSSIRRDDYFSTYRLTAVFLAYLDVALEAPAEGNAKP